MRNKLPVGKAIRAMRESKGLSRVQLSKICGERGKSVHPNAIFRLETGRGDPQMATIEAIIGALGMKIDVTKTRRAV